LPNGKGGFCVILEGDVPRRVRTHGDRLPLSFSQTKYRPSREEARWWRRLPECEKGKENGGAGDRALGRSVIMLVSKTVTVKTYDMYHGEFVIIEKAYVVDRMGLGIRTYCWQ
jgi:hypothetical protein